MNDDVNAPRKLELNTDWLTLLLACIAFIAIFANVISIWRHVILNSPIKATIGWSTWIVLVYSSILALTVRDRAVRFGLWVLAATAAMGVIFNLLAGHDTQIANAKLTRLIDGVVWTGALVYLCFWFGKIARRRESNSNGL